MNKEELEKKKADLLKKLEEEPPFDKEQFDAKMKAARGTMIESAMMMDNGEIAGKTWCHGHEGVIGDDWFTVMPNDKDYEKAKSYYALSKPGDKYSVVKKWIDDDWVVVEEKRPNKPETGKAKTA